MITSICSSSSSSLTSTDDNDITASPTSSSTSTSIIKSSRFNNFNRTDLWWIHGNGYDLKDFVHNHPGGDWRNPVRKGTRLYSLGRILSPIHWRSCMEIIGKILLLYSISQGWWWGRGTRREKEYDTKSSNDNNNNNNNNRYNDRNIPETARTTTSWS